MARNAILPLMKYFIVGEAFSLDFRGWEAAPTFWEKIRLH
jgi:hypothetical protein